MSAADSNAGSSERSRVNSGSGLSAAEAPYRELLDNANDIVYAHDLQGNFTYVNEAGARSYGYSVDEVLKVNIRHIVDPEHLALATENITAKLHGNAVTPPYELLRRCLARAPEDASSGAVPAYAASCASLPKR